MTHEQRFNLIARYIDLAGASFIDSNGFEPVKLLLRAALDECRFGAEFAAQEHERARLDDGDAHAF